MSDSVRSPLSGCTILVFAVLMLVFLIGFAIWTPFRQAAEIETFTRAEPQPVPTVEIESGSGEAAALKSRLESFRETLDNPRLEAELALNAREINLAVALFEPLAELRETFWVEEVGDDDIRVSICYQLNGRPRLAREGEDGPITADPRYLVGEMRVTPQLGKRELALRVEDLEVGDKEIPEGFMGHFSTLRIFEGFLDDERIGGGMARLTDARIEDGRLVLARVPGDPVPEVVSDEDFRSSGGKIAMFLGGAIILFLIFAGSALFIGYRAQLRKLEAAERNPANE